MTQSKINELRRSVLDELSVLEDDIHVTSDGDAMTFYLPPDQLTKAKNVLNADVEVLEEHEYEYLVRASP